jgi:hypothetical protein
MAVQALLRRLRELADTLDDCERPTFHPPASADSVSAFERVAGFPLPQDLKVFLAHVGAIQAMSIHNGYWLGGIEQLTRNVQAGSLPGVAERERAVPIATDGGGNAFLLSDSGRVWRWNHETRAVRVVSPSFIDFLKRVVADWQAWGEGTPGWHFLV